MAQVSQRFEEKIKTYLDGLAEKDEHFAKSYSNPEKSIEKCCDYIITQVQKLGRVGFDDDEIYGMAIHYYDEEDVGEIKHIDCKVVIPGQVELTDEEIEAAKKEALNRITQEEERRIKAKEAKAAEAAKKKAEEAKQEAKAGGELSLFDSLFDDEAKE